MPGKLRTEPGVADPDAFYARLIELHEGLSQDESNKLNAKIILLLANQVGDDAALQEILEYARNSLKK